MRTALLTAIRQFELTERPRPVITQNQVLVEVMACGICRSDIHYFLDGRIGNAQQAVFPQALGHECSGVVAAAPADSPFKKGDRVAIEPGHSCGSCEHCRSGFYNRCPEVQFLGSPAMQGGYAQFLSLYPDQLEHIPDSMTFDEAALLEPMGVALHAVSLARIQSGESVAVFGCGSIGLLTVALARLCGAGTVIAVDNVQHRLTVAHDLYRADHGINPLDKDVIPAITDITRGRGIDITFEAAGAQATLDYTLNAARIGGRALLIGIPSQDTLQVDMHAIRRRELLIQNVRRSNCTLKRCIELVASKQIAVAPLATHHYALDSINEGFVKANSCADGIIKAMINP